MCVPDIVLDVWRLSAAKGFPMKILTNLCSIAALVAIAGCADKSTRPEATNSNSTYEVNISIVQKIGDRSDKVGAPRLIVLENQKASISVEGDEYGYSFECLVQQEEGVATATTKGSITKDGKSLATPTIKQLVGQSANMEIDGLTIHVAVETSP